MPKLSKDQVPSVKLDSKAALIELALSTKQRRDLWERPGTVVVAVVELRSTQYVGRAETEDREPEVKVRITGCEVAQDSHEEQALLEAKRAMWRQRRIDGTFDEVGDGIVAGVDAIVAARFGPYPGEDDLAAHERKRRHARDSH